MNTKTAVIAGLIFSCTTVLHAQDDSQNPPIGNGQITDSATVWYREIPWTNEVFIPARHAISNEADLVRADSSDLQAENINYQVIALPNAADGKNNDAFPENTNSMLSGTLTESGLPDWKYGTAGHKQPIRILVIEPLHSLKDTAPDSLRLREYVFRESSPKPAWHQWLNPRLILTKWADLWMNETNATPVVLVLVKF